VIWLVAHVAFAVALASAAFVIGRRFVGRLPTASIAEEVAFSTVLGLGAIAHFLLALGLIGGLRRGPALLSVLALAIACALPWRRLRRPRITWASLGLTAACATLALLALYPSVRWDANSFHLPTAAWFVAHGEVTPAWSTRYPAFPGESEVLFALGLLFGDASCAQLVEAIFCAATALLLYAAGRRRSERAGAWAAALWLGSPLVISLGSIAYVDMGLTAFATASLLALDRWLDEKRPGWLVLSTTLAGLAASTKYLGLFFAALVGVAALVEVARRRAPARAILLAALAPAIVAAPWYAYVAHETGNPIFPFLGAWLGYGPWNAGDLALQMREMRAHGAGRSLVAVLALPFRLAFRQGLFAPEQPVSPFLWIGLLPAAWVARRDRAVRRWAIVVVVCVAGWFSGVQIYRYLVPSLPLLALAVAVSLAELLPARRRLWAPLFALLLVGPGAAWVGLELYRRGAPPIGDAARDAWLAARMPAYRAVTFARRAAAGDRVYQLYLEDYVYYAGSDVVGDFFGSWRYTVLLDQLGDAGAFADALENTGARFLVAPLPRFRDGPRVPESPRLVRRFSDENAVVYELRAQ
jgi:hypothetical protein